MAEKLPPIRAVGFDYTGVLADLPPGDIFDQVVQLTASTRDAVQAAYRRYNRDFQLGHIDQPTLWHRVLDDLHAEDRFDIVWQTANARLPIINEPVLTFVDQLRQAGYKVGLLTNLATPTPWSEDFYARKLDQHFDAVGLSGETGLVKPDSAAFKWLAAQLGIGLTELVFTDDRPSALAGTAGLGLRTVVYKSLPQLQIELRDLGLRY